MRRGFVIGVSLLTAGSFANAALAATEFVELRATTPISSHGGRLVWSEFDAVSKKYRLTTYSRGVTTALPVAPSSDPFDIDLGPDKKGRTVGVYSRCARGPRYWNYGVPHWASARRCDLYRYDFTTRRERKLSKLSTRAGSEFLPSIWRDRIAFFRSRHGSIQLYIARLAGKAVRRVTSGPARECFRDRGRERCFRVRRPTPTTLDLARGHLAFAWEYEGDEGTTFQIWLGEVRSGRARLIHLTRTGISAKIARWPVIDRGRLYYAQTCAGVPEGCHRRFFRYDIKSRRSAEATAPGQLVAHTRSGGKTFYLQAASAVTFACRLARDEEEELPPRLRAKACKLVRADPIRFRSKR